MKLVGRREEDVKAAQARKGEALVRAQALRTLISPFVDAVLSPRAIAAALNDAGRRTDRFYFGATQQLVECSKDLILKRWFLEQRGISP